MSGPLDGYRVIDCSTMITGPFAAMILGDQGADVIKVEAPGMGDVMRLLGTGRGGISALFALTNRSKRSLVLNLREERGCEILRRLVRTADVFIQNFRPGVVERLGIDEPALRLEREDLIYVSISAFGSTGPYAGKRAYDHILQGITGIAATQRDRETGRPEHVKGTVCDKVTALTVAQGVTAALLARERGHGGQHLQTNMVDASIAFHWPDGGANTTILEEDVNRLPALADSYAVMDASDGHFCVAALTNAQAHGLFRAVGRAELCEDARYATVGARVQHMNELVAELATASIDRRSVAEVLEALDAEDVPCGPVYRDVAQVVDDPQIQALGTFLESVHPQLGRMREPRPPLAFGATPGAVGRPAPALGAHGAEILGELGIRSAQIAELRTNGIVA